MSEIKEQLITSSRVLLSSAAAEKERAMLQKWAEIAAEKGGAFSIRQEFSESQWYTTYTIHWPSKAVAESLGAAK